MKIIVFGADSSIGKKISNYFDKDDFETCRTSRNQREIENSRVFCDLNHLSNLDFVKQGDFAIICFGVSSIRVCQDNPEMAWNLNYTKTIQLMKRLNEKGVRVIYLSSSSVFEGQDRICGVEQARSPKSNYAKIKCAVEDKIFKSKFTQNYSVLRLTKVLSPDSQIFLDWEKEFLRNGNIRAFNNRFVYPVNPLKVYSVIKQLIVAQKAGLFQIRGDKKISFFEICKQHFEKKGIDSDLILPELDTDQFRNVCQTPNLISTPL